MDGANDDDDIEAPEEHASTAVPFVPLDAAPDTVAQPPGPQHLSDASGATGPQHAHGLQQGGAPQRAGGDVAPGAAQHRTESATGPAAQHDGAIAGTEQREAGELRQPDTQHEPTAPQAADPPSRLTGIEHGVDAQHSGLGRAGSGHGPSTSLWRLRHLRPRLLLAGGLAAVAVVGAVVIIANQDDDPPAQNLATVETTTPAVVTDAATGTTEAGAVATTTEPAPETTAAPTTVAATTTTALPSAAGTYAVQLADVVLTTDDGSQPMDAVQQQAWTLTGACDGIGDCALSDADPPLNENSNSPFSGAPGPIPLVPAGAGQYTADFPFDFAVCGNGTNTLTLDFAGDSISGNYGYELNGLDGCPPTTLTSTFTGTRR